MKYDCYCGPQFKCISIKLYENFPMQYTRDFLNCKNGKFSIDFFFFYFSYFYSKHRMWAEAVLTSTHNLCFGITIRKICIPLHTPVLLLGVIHNRDMFS